MSNEIQSIYVDPQIARIYEDFRKIGSDTPILLQPVRLETRFKCVDVPMSMKQGDWCMELLFSISLQLERACLLNDNAYINHIMAIIAKLKEVISLLEQQPDVELRVKRSITIWYGIINRKVTAIDTRTKKIVDRLSRAPILAPYVSRLNELRQQLDTQPSAVQKATKLIEDIKKRAIDFSNTRLTYVNKVDKKQNHIIIQQYVQKLEEDLKRFSQLSAQLATVSKAEITALNNAWGTVGSQSGVVLLVSKSIKSIDTLKRSNIRTKNSYSCDIYKGKLERAFDQLKQIMADFNLKRNHVENTLKISQNILACDRIQVYLRLALHSFYTLNITLQSKERLLNKSLLDQHIKTAQSGVLTLIRYMNYVQLVSINDVRTMRKEVELFSELSKVIFSNTNMTAFKSSISDKVTRIISGLRNALEKVSGSPVYLRMTASDSKKFQFVYLPENFKELWVRIYPDSCNVSTHPSRLTQIELDRGMEFLESWYDLYGAETEQQELWTQFAKSFSINRAAFIVREVNSLITNTNDFKTSWHKLVDACIIVLHEDDRDEQDKAFQSIGEHLKSILSFSPIQVRRLDNLLAAISIHAKGNKTRSSIISGYKQTVKQKTIDSRRSTQQNLEFRPYGSIRKDDTETDAIAINLPEQYVMVTQRGDQYCHIHVGNPVDKKMHVGFTDGVLDPLTGKSEAEGVVEPDGKGNLVVNEKLLWIVDFEAAVRKGMAAALPLTEQDYQIGFDRVIVTGVTCHANTSKELNALFDTFQFSPDGCSIIPVGTPTNNTDESATPYKNGMEDPLDCYEDLFQDNTLQPDCDLIRLMKALGLQESSVFNIRNNTSADAVAVQAVNTVLFSATLGRLCEDGMHAFFTPETIERLRAFFTYYISARGVLPAFRVGSQPYGVLPVSSLKDYTIDGEEFDALKLSSNVPNTDQEHDIRFLKLATELIKIFGREWKELAENNVKNLSQLSVSEEPQKTFMEMLGLHATSLTTAIRLVLNSANRSSLIDHTISKKAILSELIDVYRAGRGFSDKIEASNKFYKDFGESNLSRQQPLTEVRSARMLDDIAAEDLSELRELKSPQELADALKTLASADEKKSFILWLLYSGMLRTYRMAATDMLYHYGLISKTVWQRSSSPNHMYVKDKDGITVKQSKWELLWDSFSKTVKFHENQWSYKDATPDSKIVYKLVENTPPADILYTLLKDRLNETNEFDTVYKSILEAIYRELKGYYRTKLKPDVVVPGTITGVNTADLNASHVAVNPDLLTPRTAEFIRGTDRGALIGGLSVRDIFTYPTQKKMNDIVKSKLKTFVDKLEEMVVNSVYLSDLPDEQVRDLVMEHLDTLAYRQDAWQTGLFMKRLDDIRKADTTKIAVGSYGWLLDVKRNPNKSKTHSQVLPASLQDKEEGVYLNTDNESEAKGYLLTPSINHAVTAAILRSGYKSNAAYYGTGDDNRFAVNLSSERIRKALVLHQGMKEGQELDALIGYQIERYLHEEYKRSKTECDALIYTLREAFRKEIQVSGEHASYSNRVVDGDAALEYVTSKLDKSEDKIELGTLLAEDFILKRRFTKILNITESKQQAQAVGNALQQARETLDAYGDLIVSEAVFQHVRGNHVRAASVMDTVANGNIPDRFEIVESIHEGEHIHTKTIAILPAPTLNTSSITASVSPALNNFASQKFASLGTLSISYSHNENSGTLTFDQLAMAATDILLAAKDTSVQFIELIRRRVAFYLRNRNQLVEDADVVVAIINEDGESAAEEMVLIARHILEVFRKTRSLRAEDLEPYCTVSDTLLQLHHVISETAEAIKNSAVEVLNILNDTLQNNDREVLDQALPLLFTLGCASVIIMPMPSVEKLSRNTVVAEIEKVVASYDAVKKKLDSIGSILNSDAYDDAAVLSDLQSVADHFFGGDLKLIPQYTVSLTDVELYEKSNDLLQHSAAQTIDISTVLEQIAQVKDSVNSYSKLQFYTEDVFSEPVTAVLQTPYSKGDCWVGLEMPESFDYSGVERNIVICNSENWSSTIAGLMLDEWYDFIPNRTKTAGISFQYDAPDSEPPQAMLLAVSPKPTGAWEFRYLLNTLEETLEMAKTRAVEPDHVIRSPLQTLLQPMLFDAIDSDVTGDRNIETIDLVGGVL